MRNTKYKKTNKLMRNTMRISYYFVSSMLPLKCVDDLISYSCIILNNYYSRLFPNYYVIIPE